LLGDEFIEVGVGEAAARALLAAADVHIQERASIDVLAQRLDGNAELGGRLGLGEQAVRRGLLHQAPNARPLGGALERPRPERKQVRPMHFEPVDRAGRMHVAVVRHQRGALGPVDLRRAVAILGIIREQFEGAQLDPFAERRPVVAYEAAAAHFASKRPRQRELRRALIRRDVIERGAQGNEFCANTSEGHGAGSNGSLIKPWPRTAICGWGAPTVCQQKPSSNSLAPV
jgi:hypothetical protein